MADLKACNADLLELLRRDEVDPYGGDSAGCEPDDYERLERLAIQSVEAQSEFNHAWPAAMGSLRGVLGDDVVACLMRAEFGGLVE